MIGNMYIYIVYEKCTSVCVCTRKYEEERMKSGKSAEVLRAVVKINEVLEMTV